MSSIRNRFFVLLSSLVIVMIVLLLLANNFLLQNFYINRKEDALEEFFYDIDNIDETEYSDFNELFREMELTTNTDIIILDSLGDIVYFSRQIDVNDPPRQIPPIGDSTDDFDFQIVDVPGVPGESLVLRGELTNGYKIELRSPISAIVENVSYINEFLLYVGIIGLALSLVIAFLMANKFTKPIREINSTTKKMKNLDFTHLINVSSKDEIGELAENINNMATTLSKTFGNLTEELSLNKKLTRKRTELLNNVSHELKTPLALIQGYSEGLALNLDTDQGKREYYTQVIIDEALNMNKIIENLLQIEDMDSNIKKSETSEVHYIEYISNKINKHKMAMKSKDISLIEDYCNEEVIHIDSYLTDRIVNNFIVNAVNYCEDSGEIKVTVNSKDNVIRTKIFNTHTELNEDDITHIWDSFYKVDQARTRDVGGHGLGLSIVKSIQENLGENYGVNNVENGVEFWFDITKK